jgi:uncharacterized protein
VLGFFLMQHWSPYLVGVGIGLLVCISFLVTGHPLGCTTAMVRIRGIIDSVLGGESSTRLAYYRLFAPAIDSQVMVLPGIVIGAAGAALLSSGFSVSVVPALWAARAGPSPIFRIIVAFVGGLLLIIGARWAGGCMCGHGISGTSQLSVASVLVLLSTLISGIAVTVLFFRVLGG